MFRKSRLPKVFELKKGTNIMCFMNSVKENKIIFKCSYKVGGNWQSIGEFEEIWNIDAKDISLRNGVRERPPLVSFTILSDKVCVVSGKGMSKIGDLAKCKRPK